MSARRARYWQESKAFFFVKKKQKTFAPNALGRRDAVLCLRVGFSPPSQPQNFRRSPYVATPPATRALTGGLNSTPRREHAATITPRSKTSPRQPVAA